MWVILGATVALAAIVTNEARRASRVQLEDGPRDYGDISMPLPVNWNARVRAEGNPHIVVQASEPKKDSRARVLTIIRDVTDIPLSPLRYLARNYHIPAPEHDTQQPWSAPQKIVIGGWPGVMISRVGISNNIPHVEFIACTVLPSRRVIVVELDGLAPSDSSDVEALKNVCSAMVIKNEPPLGDASETIEFAGGIGLTAPDDFVPVKSNDPNRTDRRLWLETPAKSGPAQWGVIDLVPVLFDGTETRREPNYAAIATLLISRDPAWSTVRISEEQRGRWFAQLKIFGEKDLSTTARLLAGENGHALMAIFHGGGDSEVYEEAWSQICASATFTGANDTQNLIDTGADEVARLRTVGLETLAGDSREDQWWLWYDQSNEPHLGWTNFKWQTKDWACKTEAHVQRPEHRAVYLEQDFMCTNSFTEYRHAISRKLGLGPQSQLTESQQFMELIDGKLKTWTRQRFGQLMGSQDAPPEYVPGGLLPILIGKLSDAPMIVRSEWFIGSEALPTQTLLTLTIRPSLEIPRMVGGKPMRCMSVEVNGSGELSRWYFRENGELECVDFVGGVQLLASDFNSIRNAFPDEFR